MMNEDMRNLIRCLAQGNLKQGRAMAKNICEREKAEKNQDFCQRMIEKLTPMDTLSPLPSNVRNLLYSDAGGVIYDDELFYISHREMALEEQLMVTQRSTDVLREVGVQYRNAALMFGPSGSGKTAFAKHLARRMERDFFMVNLSTIIESHLGGTARNLSSVFEAINAQGGGSLLFLDELDAVTENRDNNMNSATGMEMNRVTMALMQQMDMLPYDTVVLAATNHIERIDLALRRRFPITHRFETFTLEERIEMVQKYLTTIRDRGRTKGLFDFDWDECELRNYAKASQQVSHAKTIDTLTQSIADMLDDNATHLTFRALTDSSGRKIILSQEELEEMG